MNGLSVGDGRPAFRIDGEDVGRDRFYAVACDPRRSVAVEACAGAGKTWMLVSRVMRALLSGAKPQEILAITYTRKAAGEMRERLSSLLDHFASPDTSDEDRLQGMVQRGIPLEEAAGLLTEARDLYGNVLAGGRGVEVRTFHAWFAQLMRAAPRELLEEIGLQPEMSLVEDIEDIKPEIFRSFYEMVLRSDELSDDMNAVVQSRGRSQALKWLDAALDKRVEFELADSAGVLETSVAGPSDVFPRFAGMSDPADVLRMAENVDLVEGVIANLSMSKNATPQKAAAGLREAVAAKSSAEMIDGMRSALFTKAGTLKAHLKAAGLEELAALIEEVGTALDQEQGRLDHLRMVRLSRALLGAYRAFKRARGLADMADLEHCAERLLGDATLAGWVQERLDAKVRHVLIDEFQDTSPLQWKALASWLSGYGGAGGGAMPPSVFLVGDPKQSIYRFRRAEPRVFMAAKEFIRGTLTGSVLECDHTRRNAPEVVQGLNTVFGAAKELGHFKGFNRHTTEVAEGQDLSGTGVFRLEPVMRPLDGERGQKGASVEWRDTLLKRRVEEETVFKKKEADLVARAVVELVRSGVEPGEVMILSRKRSTLLLVQESLRFAGVPFAEAAAAMLADAPEVQDLLALVEVLASGRHNIALARALRSPMFNVDDSGLAWIAGESLNSGASWLHVVKAASAAQIKDAGVACWEEMARAGSCLRRLHAMAGKMGPHDLLDAILAETDYRDRVVAAVPAQARSGAVKSINALLSAALDMNGGRFSTPYMFVREFKAKAIKHPGSAQTDAVQLLTVHGAKGLESKVVFITDTQPETSRSESSTLLVDWDVNDPAPKTCAFIASWAKCPPSLVELKAKEEGFRNREELNGLYVAMTRASERVVFSSSEPHIIQKGAVSWWDRVYDVAQEWKLPEEAGAAVKADGCLVAEIAVKRMPRLRPEAKAAARLSEALVKAANNERSKEDALRSAVRRALELATPTTAKGRVCASGVELECICYEACEIEGIAAEDAQVVRAGVENVLVSEETRHWLCMGGWSWAGNQVEISHGSGVDRIERLVSFDQGSQMQWWVIGYALDDNVAAVQAKFDDVARQRRAVESTCKGAIVHELVFDSRGRQAKKVSLIEDEEVGGWGARSREAAMHEVITT